MKRILILIMACIWLYVVYSFANAEAIKGNETTSETFTLLSAVTSTGTGTATVLPGLISKSTCTVTWGGTAPTNTVVALEGSINNSTFAALSTVTVTASGTMWHMVNKPVRYIRGNYVSKSGGDGTTAVTMICIAGGN